ncbi:voltage-gated potassium channel [Haloactinopolyspora alba]|uniref:Voltage-gated potassium channel n=1 Tax=Haloactinopolyspora alba TaxID=648780 RepID=A0A2P8EFT7_9ACTN|nr:ion channel [Haloactinopolyspora alba]PSL08333.1 voltage-gated potassium channel [Haloactinopolyspora alba]
MLFILIRLKRRLSALRTGLPAAAVMAFVFVTSWPLMALVEPDGSTLVQPENYWWYFVVTGSTVGYGDFFPETTGGHVVGGYVIVGAIAGLTTLFTQLATLIEKTRGRRMQGAITVERSGHVVVLGYTAGRTERILDGIGAESSRAVVLGAWEDVETHPMPDRDVEFVRGELVDEAVLRRAGVDRAYSVLVDARDDNEALAMAVCVEHVNPDTHLVVTLRDMNRADHVSYVSDSIRCVQWHVPRMATEELQDPGITQVYTQLMTHGGGNTYSMAVPASWGAVTFGQCQTAFGRDHDATVLAARTSDELLVSPSWRTELPAGTVLYYVGRARLDPEQVDVRGSAPA